MPAVSPVRLAAVCRLCRRDLEMRVDTPRESGKVKVSLKCPVHGALRHGERYLHAYVANEASSDPGQ